MTSPNPGPLRELDGRCDETGLRYVWGTRSRGGSQFLLAVTRALLGKRLLPESRITGSRQEGLKVAGRLPFRDYFERGNMAEYFRANGIRALKLEEPARDPMGRAIANAFPHAKWLGNYRDIKSIVESHYNLHWGYSEGKLLGLARRNLSLYKRLASENRLFIMNIDEPNAFDLAKMAAYLECDVTEQATKIVKEWLPVNDLAEIRNQSGRPLDHRERPARIESLFQRYRWIEDIEHQYIELWRATST